MDGSHVHRRVKDADGHCVLKNKSVPPAVQEYNRFMGGVDLSDSLINYIKVIHKTQKCYKTLFYHFMDIAIVNAFLLYKDLTKGKGKVPMHQKAFRETLVEELAAAAKRPAPSSTPRSKRHKPFHITQHSTMGRHGRSPVKCSSCDIPWWFVPNRDCYKEWHSANNLLI